MDRYGQTSSVYNSSDEIFDSFVTIYAGLKIEDEQKHMKVTDSRSSGSRK